MRSVGSVVGTVTEVIAAASRLLLLPDHSTALPLRSGSLVTTDHCNGIAGSDREPLKDSERRSRPLRTVPFAACNGTKSAPFGAAPGSLLMSGLAWLIVDRRLGVVTRLFGTPRTTPNRASPMLLSSNTMLW